MNHRLRVIAMVIAGLLAAGARPLAAQEPPRVRVGAGLSADLLVGDASDFLDSGIGRFLMGDFRLGTRELFSVRLDASWNSLEDDENPSTGITADNDVFVFAIGPQVTGTLGRFRPYAAVLAAFTTVAWRTESPTVDGGVAEQDGSETGMAGGGHAGLGITLDEGDHPVVLQIEGRILDAGEFDFARSTSPSGSWPYFIHEDFAVLSLRIAVTLGF